MVDQAGIEPAFPPLLRRWEPFPIVPYDRRCTTPAGRSLPTVKINATTSAVVGGARQSRTALPRGKQHVKSLWALPLHRITAGRVKPAGRSVPCSQLKEGDSTAPKYRPCGAACRIRTGDTCLEGRGVTTTPMLRITAGAFNRRAGLSLRSRQEKKKRRSSRRAHTGWRVERDSNPAAFRQC